MATIGSTVRPEILAATDTSAIARSGEFAAHQMRRGIDAFGAAIAGGIEDIAERRQKKKDEADMAQAIRRFDPNLSGADTLALAKHPNLAPFLDRERRLMLEEENRERVKDAAQRAADSAAREKFLHDQAQQDRAAKRSALKKAWTPPTEEWGWTEQPTPLGEAVKPLFGRLLDEGAWGEASARPEQPVPATEGEGALPVGRPLGEEYSPFDPRTWSEIGSEPKKPPYLGDMIRRAAEKIGAIELEPIGRPRRSFTRTVQSGPSPMSASRTREDFFSRMHKLGLTEAEIPFVAQLAREAGLPSEASLGGMGVQSLLRREGHVYDSRAQAAVAFDKASADLGVPVGAGAKKAWLDTADILDVEALQDRAQKLFKDQKLDMHFSAISELSKLEGLLTLAKENDVARMAAVKTLARLFDRGPLSEYDTRPFAGASDIPGEFSQWFKEKTEGGMTPGNFKILTDVVQAMVQDSESKLNIGIPLIVGTLANNYRISEDRVHKHTLLNERLPPDVQSPEAVETLQIRLQDVPVGGEITFREHTYTVQEAPGEEGRNLRFLIDEDGQPWVPEVPEVRLTPEELLEKYGGDAAVIAKELGDVDLDWEARTPGALQYPQEFRYPQAF